MFNRFSNRKCAWLIVPLLAMSLAACGPTDSSSPSSSSSAQTYANYDPTVYGDPTSLKATVTFWTTYGKGNSGPLENLANAFMAKYPNISVDMSYQGGYGDIQDKLKKAIVAGTTPTMAICYPDHVADYIDANNAVVSLQGFVDDPLIGLTAADGSHLDGNGNAVSGEKDYVEGYWDEGKAYQNAGLYSLPFSKSTEALYYNQTVFTQMGYSVPTTWGDMWSLCNQIRDDFPGDPSSGGKYALGYDSDSNLFITMCEQYGYAYTSATGDHYLFDNAGAKAMVSQLYQYYQSGCLRTKNSTANGAYASTAFVAGDTLMCISSTGGASYQNTTSFSVGVAKPPVAGDGKVISQGPSICVFSRASKAEQYAAWLFYRFCTTDVNSAYFATSSTGYDPVRLSSYDTTVYTDWAADNNSTIFGKTAAVTESLRDSYFYSPVFVGSATARTEVGDIIGNVFVGGKTVDEAFTTALTNCVTA